MSLNAGSIVGKFTLAVLLVIPVLSFAKDASESRSQADSFSEVSEPVDLKFKQITLNEALQLVTRSSGVTFSLHKSLRGRMLNTQISALDWTSATKELLSGFSYLAIVDRSGSFRRVIITGIAGTGSASADSRFIGAGVDTANETSTIPLSETPILLWRSAFGVADENKSSIPTKYIQVLPNALESIRVGQPLEITIPQEGFPIFGVVAESHMQLNGEITVWSGPIDAFHDTASFTVTRGKILTFITVATGVSVYEFSINNKTGAGTVVNALDLIRDKNPNDTVVPPLNGPGV